MLRFAWLLAGASAVTQTFYVCNDAGDLDFRGSYDLDEDTHANKPTWTNAQGKTIFAHGPFWYIGDLSPHPAAPTISFADDDADGESVQSPFDRG